MKGAVTIGVVALLATGLGASEAQRGSSLTRDGVPVVWELRGSGDPTLVFVHCWACDRQFFSAQIDDLARDHQVLSLDLPGHGESGAGREHWSISGLGADVAALVEERRLDPVVLVGHSMGGPVALDAARRLAGRVEGVVLVDTLHDAELEFPEELLEQLASAFEADYEAAMAQMLPGMFPEGADPALREWVMGRALAADRRAAVALLRGFADVDEKALLSGAGAPVRAVNARPLPPAIPPTAVETNRRYAPDYDAILIGGVGHYLQLEKPAEFNAALREALRQIREVRHPR